MRLSSIKAHSRLLLPCRVPPIVFRTNELRSRYLREVVVAREAQEGGSLLHVEEHAGGGNDEGRDAGDGALGGAGVGGAREAGRDGPERIGVTGGAVDLPRLCGGVKELTRAGGDGLRNGSRCSTFTQGRTGLLGLGLTQNCGCSISSPRSSPRL
jgi:hypothetical protein